MLAYFMRLNDAEKKSVIELLKTIMKSRKDQVGHLTLEQYNKEIDEAMERVNRGEYTTFEDLSKCSHGKSQTEIIIDNLTKTQLKEASSECCDTPLSSVALRALGDPAGRRISGRRHRHRLRRSSARR